MTNNEFKTVFPERLRAALKKNDMSQAELAKRLRITQAALSRYIHGERIPKAPVVVNIAKITNVEVGWLLGMYRGEAKMTLKEYILKEILDDETISYVFDDNQNCDDCPISDRCEKEDVCFEVAKKNLYEEI